MFNYQERTSQTPLVIYRERGIKTDPPQTSVFSKETTQWMIFDAFMQQYEDTLRQEAEEAAKGNLDIDVKSLDELKTFNKDKKLVKKWAKQFSLLLASDTVLKKVPVVVGPILTRINRFPTVVSHKESLAQKIADTRASVKFQLKKVTCMATAVGHVEMSDEELKQNIMMSLNFLASLLKKGWHNIKTIYIKTTMSPAIKLL